MTLSQALQHLLKAELISLQDPPLKSKIQDMIDNKEIEFDPPETPNVITAPMPKHDKGISVVEDVLYITFVNDMVTPLSTIKNNLLQAGLFLGCVEGCYYCTVQPNVWGLLKEVVQNLMDEHVILIEKILSLCQVLSVISGTPFRIPFKGPIRITANPKAAPLVITIPEPIPYSSDKAIPWHYGFDVYYHGVK